MEIDIPFNDWSKNRLLDRRKTATTRSKRYGEPGDTFEVDLSPRPFKSYELVSIELMTLKEIAEEHYDEEGAESPQEFIEVWNEIHPFRKYRPDDKKWFHKFKEV